VRRAASGVTDEIGTQIKDTDPNTRAIIST